MANIETEVFDKVYRAMLTTHPSLKMASEYVDAPAEFPFATLMQVDTASYTRTANSATNENHVTVMFQLDTYSNKRAGNKAECKTIAEDISSVMVAMGFIRMSQTPTPNLYDNSIYRITTRFSAVIDNSNTIYRR